MNFSRSSRFTISLVTVHRKIVALNKNIEKVNLSGTMLNNKAPHLWREKLNMRRGAYSSKPNDGGLESNNMAAISNVRSRLFAKVRWQSSLSLTSKTLASASQTSSQYCIDLVRWE